MWCYSPLFTLLRNVMLLSVIYPIKKCDVTVRYLPYKEMWCYCPLFTLLRNMMLLSVIYPIKKWDVTVRYLPY